jgi:hypothetical protein
LLLQLSPGLAQARLRGVKVASAASISAFNCGSSSASHH